jgi:hypothetical protein
LAAWTAEWWDFGRAGMRGVRSADYLGNWLAEWSGGHLAGKWENWRAEYLAIRLAALKVVLLVFGWVAYLAVHSADCWGYWLAEWLGSHLADKWVKRKVGCLADMRVAGLGSRWAA